jgi:lysine-specific demethylase/histidyl-hydroxylase NO66
MTRHPGAAPEATALRRCVGDVTAFLDRAWTRQVHLHPRTDSDTYADLLSLDHVDQLLTETSPRRPAVRAVRDGREVPPSAYTRAGTLGSQPLHDLPDVAGLMQLFDDGATIVLQGLQRTWPPVGRFCRELELVLTHPVQANAYLTPPSAQGLRVHHDTHDVFALQTYGHKRWVIYPPVIDHPLPGQRWGSSTADHGPPEVDTELAPGDCLYVPRGVLHAAATTGDASLHLTIGVRAVTWHDVARRLVEDATTGPAFREALPAGFARQPEQFRDALAARLKELADVIASTDVDALAGREIERLWDGLLPRLDGQLTALLDLDAITNDTVTRPRHPLPFTVTVDGDRLRVRMTGRALSMPAYTEPALRALLSGPVRLSNLPGTLDAPSRIVLAKRLVREGLLVVDREAS